MQKAKARAPARRSPADRGHSARRKPTKPPRPDARACSAPAPTDRGALHGQLRVLPRGGSLPQLCPLDPPGEHQSRARDPASRGRTPQRCGATPARAPREESRPLRRRLRESNPCLPLNPSQIFDGNSFLFTALGSGLWPVMVLLSEIVQTFILGDFCYYYVRSFAEGGSVRARSPEAPWRRPARAVVCAVVSPGAVSHSSTHVLCQVVRLPSGIV